VRSELREKSRKFRFFASAAIEANKIQTWHNVHAASKIDFYNK